MSLLEEIRKSPDNQPQVARNLFSKSKFKSMKQPKKLCGGLWAEGEFAFLFADNGIGKSIFSVQIACNIAEGKSITHFENETQAQPILYIDAELSDFQFYNRYPWPMHENFNRYGFEATSELLKASIEDIFRMIKECADESNAKVIVLDNLSALSAMVDGTNTKEGILLMGLLNELKKDGYSILVIDHSRKPMKEGDYKIISKNDLQGSKMKTNLADSIFSMGWSILNDKLRYIKSLKIRSSEFAFKHKGVATMELMAGDQAKDKRLRLEFVGFNEEWEHVNERKKEAHELASNGLTQKEIAERIGVSQQHVSRILSNGEKVPF